MPLQTEAETTYRNRSFPELTSRSRAPFERFLQYSRAGHFTFGFLGQGFLELVAVRESDEPAEFLVVNKTTSTGIREGERMMPRMRSYLKPASSP